MTGAYRQPTAWRARRGAARPRLREGILACGVTPEDAGTTVPAAALEDDMERWLCAALDYIPQWLGFQMRLHGQTGCVIAVARAGRPVFEAAFGHADVQAGVAMTPRHRFRVASHSKTFTATAIMKLRDAGRLRLDDPIGSAVAGLPPHVARLTYTQLMSHGAGLVRDGADGGQWTGRRPFKSAAEVLDELAGTQPLAPSTRFKYSNQGYALLGMAIEAIGGLAYGDWMMREVIGPSGLEETLPDAPVPRDVLLACGHCSLLPLGERIAFPVDGSARAIAPAGGFVSSAADLVRFFAALDPAARRSVLSADARREMVRRLWPDPDSSIARWYGLGTMSGTLAGPDGPSWDWFGHSGVFPGCLTRTVCLPEAGLTVSVLTNASDGLCQPWLDGVVHVLRRFSAGGAPSPRTAPWSGRWWTPSLAIDLVPMADRVHAALPAQFDPFLDAAVLTVAATRGADRLATITRDGGFGRHGEAARLVAAPAAGHAELQLGGTCLEPEARLVKTLKRRLRITPGGRKLPARH
jgi:CubicO group peptidase (beta-lactamase class C family)